MTHSVYRRRQFHSKTPEWLLLGDEVSRWVKAREAPYPKPTKHVWSCGLCRDNMHWGVTYSDAEAHVKYT